jgi:hypothetical protein
MFTEVTDNSFHHYVIPFEKLGEWDQFMQIPEDDERSWEVPAWAECIDRGRLAFTSWQIV